MHVPGHRELTCSYKMLILGICSFLTAIECP